MVREYLSTRVVTHPHGAVKRMDHSWGLEKVMPLGKQMIDVDSIAFPKIYILQIHESYSVCGGCVTFALYCTADYNIGTGSMVREYLTTRMLNLIHVLGEREREISHCGTLHRDFVAVWCIISLRSQTILSVCVPDHRDYSSQYPVLNPHRFGKNTGAPVYLQCITKESDWQSIYTSIFIAN